MRLIRSEWASRPRSNERGFSLLEVLAALVVTAVLMLALTPFVGQMLATWSKGGEQSHLVELKSRGLGRLRTDLKHALVWTGYGETENLLAFRGDESSMTFPISTGLGMGRAGLEMVSISVDTSLDGRALVRRRAMIVGTTYTAFQDPVVLFSGQFKFLFKYYSRDNKEETIWRNPTEMPARVELRISNDRGLVYLPIEIPIFASMSTGCIALTNLPGCPSPPPTDPDAWMDAFGLRSQTQ